MLRIGIADVSDSNYDSTIMIAAGSGTTKLVAFDDVAQLEPGGSTNIDVLANDIDSTNGVLFVTHINGIAVSPGDSVTLTTGQVITLNADGTLSAVGDADEETVNFTYQIENSAGDSDTGFITINQVP